MTRAPDLGPSGEQEARRLFDVHNLNPGFEIRLLLSPHEKALEEVRRRLETSPTRC